MVEKAKILFPLSQIGAISEGQRLDLIKGSDLYGKYDTPEDRESAFETLLAEAEQGALVEAEDKEVQVAEDEEEKEEKKKGGKKKTSIFGRVAKAVWTAVTATFATLLATFVSDKISGKKTKSKTSATTKVVKNATSAATRSITRELSRDIFGNLIK